MNRVRLLKKEKIKTTISGLALMIAIGAAGGIGSYAYFTAQAEVDNSLEVTMGTLSTSIGSGINGNIRPSGSISNNFDITNTGTLDQIASLYIYNIGGNNKDISNLECNIKVTSKQDSSKVIYENKTTLTDIQKNPISLGTIKSGEDNELNCSIVITSTNKENFVGKEVTFDLDVRGEQINKP